ncbi:unnamed protein product [Heterobilharzia americana]|nr:unnamed protein product [Heterobilharzia americana]
MESLAVLCASDEFRNHFDVQYSESLCILWQNITEELDLLIHDEKSSNCYKIFLRDSLIPVISKIFLEIQSLNDNQPQRHEDASRCLMHKLMNLNEDPLLNLVARECSQIIMYKILSKRLPTTLEISHKLGSYSTRSSTQPCTLFQKEQSSEHESICGEFLDDDHHNHHHDKQMCTDHQTENEYEMTIINNDAVESYIEKQFNLMVKEIELHLSGSIQEEHDSLVQFLQYPMNSIDNFSYDSFIASLVQHAYDLIKLGSEDQFVRLLQVFNSLSKASMEKPMVSETGQNTAHYILCSNGICDLIVRCIENPSTSETVFIMAIELAINLLKYGNKHVQECFYSILSKPKIHEDFFNVIFQRIHNAYSQAENLTKNRSSVEEDVMTLTNYPGYTHQVSIVKNVPAVKTLKFLQTLCNRSNLKLQEILRVQPHNVTTFNLVEEMKSLFLKMWEMNDHIVITSITTGNNDKSSDDNPQLFNATCKKFEEQRKVNHMTRLKPHSPIEKKKVKNIPNYTNTYKRSVQTLISNRANENQEITQTQKNSNNNNNNNANNSGPLNACQAEIIILILTCLTEFCQGPCVNNQNDIVFGSPDILYKLVNLILDTPGWIINNNKLKDNTCLLTDINFSSIKLLLAVLEGRIEDSVYQRLLDLWPIDSLINTVRNYYILSQNSDVARDHSGELIHKSGHMLFILAQHLYRCFPVILKHMKISDNNDNNFSKTDLSRTKWSELNYQNAIEAKHLYRLESIDDNSSSTNDVRKLRLDITIIKRSIKNQSDSFSCLQHYSMNTAQIEIVRENNIIERLIYPIPEICHYLTNAKKHQLLNWTVMDDDHSKIPSMFEMIEDIYAEMLCAKHMLVHTWIHWFSLRSQWISDASFYQTLCLNVLLVIFYPFQEESLSLSFTKIEEEITLIPLAILAVILCLICSNQFTVQIYVGLEALYLLLICGSENIISVMGLTNLIFRLFNLIIIYKQHRLIMQYKNHLSTNQSKSGSEAYSQQLTSSEISEEKQTVFTSLLHLSFQNYNFLSVKKLLNWIFSSLIHLKSQNISQLHNKVIQHAILIIFAVFGVFLHPLFHSLVLLDIITREETLLNVVRSVTKNGRSIFLTGILALIIIYLYSIIGFTYFRDDFAVEVDPTKDNEEINGNTEHRCDSLRMCMLTTLREGLLNGGGIGEALRRPSNKDSSFIFRTIYDLSFFVIVIVIILNLIFGVIVDTFAALRQEKQNSEELNKNHCSVCGLHRSAFDHSNTSFDEHVEVDHNVWHYIYFIIYLKTKSVNDLTGPEIYINKLIKKREFKWIPRRRAMTLHIMETVSPKKSEEIDNLRKQLEKTMSAVHSLNEGFKNLSKQITKENMEKSKEKLISCITNSLSNHINGEE